MNLDRLKAIVAQHSEKPVRFPDDTPESFWLGYDAAMYDFLRLLDEQIAFGQNGSIPGDFIMELQPMIPAGRGLYKKAPQHQVVDLLGGLIKHLEAKIGRWYENVRPNIKVELSRARQSLEWAEERLRSMNATPIRSDEAHSHNPEYELRLQGLADRARNFVAENIGSTEYRKFDDGSRKRDHAKQAGTGEME